MPAFTGAEASATACFSHGRRFSLLPLHPQAFPLDGSAVLNDTPVACQIRGPTRRETGAPISRRRQPPPTHCGASRRNGRDLIIAKNDQRTSPYPRCCQRQRRKRYKRSPEPTMTPTAPIPRSQHRQICTYPPRAKGSLDRRSKRLSFSHFFLHRKKCGRRRPPPRQGETDSPPQRRNPPRAKGFLNRRSKWFSLVTFFLQKKKVTRAGARNAPACARRRTTCSLPPALSLT